VKLSPGPASLTRQDTIEEGGEGDSNNSRESSHRPSIQIDGTEKDSLPGMVLRTGRDKERDSASSRKERDLSLERERQIEMAKARETTCDNYDSGLREQPSTIVQRDLISTVLDMKVDVRLEMQRMSQRISRIEDLLSDLVNRLTVDSSELSTPGDSNPGQLASPTSTSIQVPTTQTTTTTSSALGGSAQGSGNGLGQILLRKRRQKNKKAPAPPPKQYQSPESEQARLIESAEMPSTSSGSSTTRKREFL
jgi:potassium voltage-gated channel Eag-related subfamily H protein